MNSLKKKASRFFSDSSSDDSAETVIAIKKETHVDVGTQGRRLRAVSSRFFSRRVDEELPPIPSIVTVPDSPVTPVSPSSPTSAYTVFEEDEPFAVLTTVTSGASRSPKEPTGFRLLKKKSSQLLRKARSSRKLASSPPPPVPAIPAEPMKLQKTRPNTITPSNIVRSNVIKSSLQTKPRSISSPMPSPQLDIPQVPSSPATVPVNKPKGPAPRRPSRPSSLVDEEIIAIRKESAERYHLPLFTNRVSTPVSPSTTACTTPQSDTSFIPIRLGLPMGCGTPPLSPHSPLTDPLAASFPPDFNKPLPIRDSAGSLMGYSSYSDFIRSMQDYPAPYDVSGDKKVDQAYPVEMYSKEKEKDWIAEKRISDGPGKTHGRLFQDRWGCWHFVPDL